MSRVRVTHFTDPGCPWAWSASPALAQLRWRYGDQLEWRHVMIGLTEFGSVYEERGYTGPGQARGYRNFRWRGMPFSTEPRERVHGTWPMCRVVVATRRLNPEREYAVFRALQPWVKVDLFNAFNNQTLIGWNTSVAPDPDSPLDALGLPTGYLEGPRFGEPRGSGDYPRSLGVDGGRTFRMAVGIRF